MKNLTASVLALGFALALSAPAQSVEPLALYDNFDGQRINPDLWDPRTIDSFILDAAREVRNGRLRLFARVYGDTSVTDGGRNLQPLRLFFKNSDAVTSIESWVRVNSVNASGCPVPTGTSSRIGYRISGYYYNDGSGGPGDATGDVWASFELRRGSGSTAPPGEMRIITNVFHCQDPACDTGIDLHFDDTTFGTASLGQLIRLLLEFDPATNTFAFQRDFQPSVVVPVAIPNLGPPAFRKRIGIRANVENCAEAPRPVVDMETDVFLVRTNVSAVPPP